MLQSLFRTIESIASWIILLPAWRRAFVVFCTGAFSAFAMAPFFLLPILFITFPVFIWSIDGCVGEGEVGFAAKAKQGFWVGFAFGFGYFVSGLWWIGSAFLVEAEAFAWALPLGVIALPAVLAIFWGVAIAAIRPFWTGNLSRVFLLAAALGLAEFCRGFVATGFPWNTISYAVLPIPIMMQSASIFGVYGLVPLTVLAVSIFAVILPGNNTSKRSFLIASSMCVLLFVGHIGFGFYRLSAVQPEPIEGLKIRVVQPSIPQDEKFDRTKHQEHLQRYLELSAGGVDGQSGLSKFSHLIWPESVFPYFLTENKDTLAKLAALLPQGTQLITGAARAEQGAGKGGEPLVFNSVYAVNNEGLITAAADKVHLVPFGEYLPFKTILGSFGLQQMVESQAGFQSGNSRQLIESQLNGRAIKILPLICYEIIFSGAIWNSPTRPDFIVNLTNDAWFGNTPGPFQHEHQAIVRGVEEGLSLVRVANSGVSGIYDAYGRPQSRTALGAATIVDGTVSKSLNSTAFAKFGRYIFFAIIVLFLLVGVQILARNSTFH